ncbi:hypothetical protein BDR07DRAFT_1565429 [Suillus spraguei]|nr:hypothetical protein BDR07DRAFT_1565429 [Suillus spraguei]
MAKAPARVRKVKEPRKRGRPPKKQSQLPSGTQVEDPSSQEVISKTKPRPRPIPPKKAWHFVSSHNARVRQLSRPHTTSDTENRDEDADFLGFPDLSVRTEGQPVRCSPACEFSCLAEAGCPMIFGFGIQAIISALAIESHTSPSLTENPDATRLVHRKTSTEWKLADGVGVSFDGG